MKAKATRVFKSRGNKWRVDIVIDVPEDFAGAAKALAELAWLAEDGMVELLPAPASSVPHTVEAAVTRLIVEGFVPPASERTYPQSAFASPTVCGTEASTDPTRRCVAVKGHMKGRNPAEHIFVKVEAIVGPPVD